MTTQPHARVLLALRLRDSIALDNYLNSVPDADLRDVIRDLLDTAARETGGGDPVAAAARYLEGQAA